MKMYRLTLSSPEKTVEINQRLPDGRAVRVPVRLRSLELEMLDACFLALSNHATRHAEYYQCIKYMQIIQGINGVVKFMDFNKSDMENLFRGFELTAGNRNESWVRCVELHQQIEGPEEIENP